MPYQKDRYLKYRLALLAATQDADFMSKHPDFAQTHARVFYDDLAHEGYHWYPVARQWSKVKPIKNTSKAKKEIPDEGHSRH